MDTEQYFKSISMELKALENRIRYLINDTHWPTDGEWKESILRQVIQRSCPKNISVGRGFIITEAGNSSQIDILLYDNTQPVIYSDGDLVFIQPSSCRGIIEVKSTYSSPVYRNACESISDAAKLVRDSEPDLDIFVGVFIYEMRTRQPRIDLELLKELTDEHIHKTIDHVCLGQHKFIKFWEQCPLDRAIGYDHWHLYRLEDMAFGYFIHNLLSVISGHRLVRNEMIWFPAQGKEHNRENSLRRT
ncbi:hypothetical protein L1076_05135 [Vibrio sp. MMG022]|uniref:DUF6602 domain-containing protein n=1 Tax=Vibrio sp. MMG023 TaxID=2909979 RepID=UPI001F40FAE7|nr:DUF6602 domain-containing protein [Vibrio sp. MMG023]MCF6450970.1 hypothetical protein [Vibrio sp. MMG023]